MGLFETKQTYKSVVDYLVALSDQEYKKLIKVVNIRRKSNSDVSGLLNGMTLETYQLEYEDIAKPVKVTNIRVTNAPLGKKK